MSRLTVAVPMVSGLAEVPPVDLRSKLIGRPRRACWCPTLAPDGWLGHAA